MSHIPTPPASRPGSEAPEASEELLQSLDTLLEQYLHLLDRQQQLRSGLAKQLSSGFLSLAHANYTCPPGRRYGSDYYDERMKATRTIALRTERDENETSGNDDSHNRADEPHSQELEHRFSIEYRSERQTDEKTDDSEAKQPASDEESDQATESAAETHTPANDGQSSESPESPGPDTTTAPKTSNTTRKKFQSHDPIYWYGILVPPSLRHAQKSFTEAIETQVPELAGAVVQMRALEKRIGQVRAQLEKVGQE